MANILNVPHYPQETDGLCLPACIQMVLAYWGISIPQKELARRLGTRPHIGTPHRRITHLQFTGLTIHHAADGDLATLRDYLSRAIPLIVFVQTADLPYWNEHPSRHALVVIGMERNTITVIDPGTTSTPHTVPVGDFLLAWDEMDATYAIIARSL